jgi:hypothetical protein
MTLLFADSFDHYATADITKKWNSTGGGTINSTAGRRSGGAYRGSSNGNTITKTFAANASVVVGFAYKASAIPGTDCTIATLLDAGSVQCNLGIKADGTLYFNRNGTALTGGASTLALSSGAFYYIEWKITIANSVAADSCKVRVNGVDWITIAAGQDTQATANATCNQLRIGVTGGDPGDADFDDLYLCNQSGGTNNDFLGDIRVDAIFPNADGNYSQFTPSSGTDHYLLVDETTPNTSDYNDGDTVGDRDSYAFGNLTALTSQTVYGVQVNAAVLKDDAGAKSASTFARSGSTNTDGASTALSTTQAYLTDVYETDPNGGGAWTETSVNAAEFGVRVTA